MNILEAYEKAELELILFSNEDIITVSNGDLEDHEGPLENL